jgi:hypothetical protein
MRLRSIREAVNLDALPEPPVAARKAKRRQPKSKSESLNFKFWFDNFEHDLTSLTPDAIHDHQMCQHSYSVIYSPENGGLYISKEGESHNDMISDLHGHGHADSYSDASRIQSDYYSLARDSVFCRIGQNLRTDTALIQMVVVSFYTDEHSHELVPGVIDALLAEGHITEDAVVIHGDEISKAGDVMAHGTSAASTEKKERAKLQIAYHLGAWPDGRRLTPEEKKAIANQLGFVGSTKSKWQDEGEKAGIVPRGAKYWALTSEGRRS